MTFQDPFQLYDVQASHSSSVCPQYYSPNSENLWVGQCHVTAQIHCWSSTAVTSFFWLCLSASCLLEVCECKDSKNSHPKVPLLYPNSAFRENILQRTQSRWTVSTEALYPRYTVEALILVWWRFHNTWKTGTCKTWLLLIQKKESEFVD